METTVVENKVEAVVEEVKVRCFWKVVDVDAEGNIIIKVYNKAKQNEMNKLIAESEKKHSKKKAKTIETDDKYAQLVEDLGFEANIDIFSAAGKAYVYNVKRELIKDIKLEGNKQAMQEGRAAASERKASKRTEKVPQVLVAVNVEELEDITL